MKFSILFLMVALLSTATLANDVQKTLKAFKSMEPIFNRIHSTLPNVKEAVDDKTSFRQACFYIGQLDPQVGQTNTGNLISAQLIFQYLTLSNDSKASQLLPQAKTVVEAANSLNNDVYNLDDLCDERIQPKSARFNAAIDNANKAYLNFESALMAVEAMQK